MLPKVTAVEAAMFRSRFEAQVFKQIAESGVAIDYESNYEPLRFKVKIPARIGHYTPDLVWPDRKIAIETKGRFDDAASRQKLILFGEQHPEWDIRILFQRAKVPLYKGSKTTQEKWAEDHGFRWAVGEMPAEWLEDLR